MGQKVHPIGFRLAVTKDWRSKWYAPPEEYADQLHCDLKIRDFLKNRLQKGAVSKVLIERAWNSVRVTLHTSRPGLIIGKRGAEIEGMTNVISKMCAGAQVKIDIFEIKQPETDAQWVAEQVATQLERRISFRRAMKQAIAATMRVGAEGIKVKLSGRLGGAEMARSEMYKEGRIPLHTLRADIDYALSEALTVYGLIGIKVWIFKGEVYGKRDLSPNQGAANEPKGQRGPAPKGRDKDGPKRRKRN